MKHTSYIPSLVCALASALMFIFSSCSDEELESRRGSPVMEEFPLEEARSYFEVEAESLQSRSSQSSDTLPLSSGDFIPRWDRAVPSRKNGTCRYDISMDGTYRYTAVRLERRNHGIYAREVSVYQRLVLVKDTRSNLIGQYVLSLIPEKRCDSEHAVEEFLSGSGKSGFSGTAIYSCPYSWRTARVNTYLDGVKTAGVFLLNSSDSTCLSKHVSLARFQTYGLLLQRHRALQSRGEEEWGGMVDGGWIDDIVCTPDPEPEPFPEPNPFPDPDPDPDPEETYGWEYGEDGYEPNNEDEGDLADRIVFSKDFPEDKKQQVKDIIRRICSRTILRGKDLPDGLNIRYERKSSGLGFAGKENDGGIYLKDNFFNSPNETDRDAILYHEMCHVMNDRAVSPNVHVLDNPVIPTDIPYEIEMYLMDRIRQYYPDGISDDDLKEQVKAEITINQIRDSGFYENELNAYQEEKDLFSDDELSDAYKGARDFAEWDYEQKHQIAKENNY